MQDPYHLKVFLYREIGVRGRTLYQIPDPVPGPGTGTYAGAQDGSIPRAWPNHP